jgi:hypothetical protein
MKSAGLDKWTGKVGVILRAVSIELSSAESFALKIEDEVDEASLPLIDQVWDETGARE